MPPGREPRLRGEYESTTALWYRLGGTPPPTRGIHPVLPVRPGLRGNTPAYAWNTLLDLHVSCPKPGFACGLHSRTHAFPVSCLFIMGQTYQPPQLPSPPLP